MKPIETISKLYYDLFPTGQFGLEIKWYVEHGLFHSDPTVAYLARPADTRIPESYGSNPDKWGNGHWNAWCVAYAAGDIRDLCRHLVAVRPHYPYIIFERTQWEFGKSKVLKTTQFINTIKKYNYGKQSISRTAT